MEGNNYVLSMRGKICVEIFLLLLCQIISVYVTAQDDSKMDFCENPIPSDNPVDLKWLHEHFEEGWNIQYGHPDARKQFALFLKGFNDTEEDDFSKMCSRLKLDYVDEHFEGSFTGYGDKAATFNCTSTFACDLESSDKVIVIPTQIHISYFDGKGKDEHNLAVIIQCVPLTGESWYGVFSISKTISEEEEKIATEHLKSIGFDTSNRVPFRNADCQ